MPPTRARAPLPQELSGFRIRFLVSHRRFAETEKKRNISEVATEVSFVALSGPFFNRLDIFSNARLLKITLVLLFFCDYH